MTCSETREFLYSFLDNELEAPLSMDLQRHLERCPECAQQIEIERAIQHSLKHALNQDPGLTLADQQRLEAVVEQAVSRTRRRSVWSRRRLLGMGVAAAVALAPAIWHFTHKDRPATGSCFAALLVTDFEHVMQRENRVEIASGDSAAVEGWLREQTALPVRLPQPGEPFNLLGGRRCSIAGHTAALALYQADQPASLLVMPAAVADLKDMTWHPDHQPPHWATQCQGHTVVAGRRGPLVYALVSRLPEKELVRLLPDETHEIGTAD